MRLIQLASILLSFFKDSKQQKGGNLKLLVCAYFNYAVVIWNPTIQNRDFLKIGFQIVWFP